MRSTIECVSDEVEELKTNAVDPAKVTELEAAVTAATQAQKTAELALKKTNEELVVAKEAASAPVGGEDLQTAVKQFGNANSVASNLINELESADANLEDLADVVADAGDDDAKETMEYTKESLAASLQQANSLKNALREFRDALKANGLGG